jgi:hypothetical protein
MMKLAIVGLSLLMFGLSTGSASAQALYLTWVGVVDNGEGDGMHGPHGNLHVTLHNARGKKYESFIIEGPSRREFLDGDQAWYNIFLGYLSPGNPAIYVKIWESDPGPFRGHDTLFEGWVSVQGVFRSGYAAPKDARRNAVRRGANRWVRDVWGGDIRPGVPKMFARFELR